MGTFQTRKDATKEAKASLFSDWFVLVRFTDDTWDYAQPGRPLTTGDRAEEIMYQRSRATGDWYSKRTAGGE